MYSSKRGNGFPSFPIACSLAVGKTEHQLNNKYIVVPYKCDRLAEGQSKTWNCAVGTCVYFDVDVTNISLWNSFEHASLKYIPFFWKKEVMNKWSVKQWFLFLRVETVKWAWFPVLAWQSPVLVRFCSIFWKGFRNRFSRSEKLNTCEFFFQNSKRMELWYQVWKFDENTNLLRGNHF